MNYLLDSSVIAKWFLDEPGSNRALNLQHRYLSGSLSLFYAQLSLYEVANALLYSREFKATEVADATAALAALNMQQLGFEERALSKAIIVSGQYGIAIYDSYLVTLAEMHHLIFLTADRKLLRRLPSLDWIRDFGIYPPYTTA